MSNLIRRFVQEDQGQDLVEYAMLLALIALVVAAGVTTFGTTLQTWYTNLSTAIPIAS
jgi:pilus assembly protein Flp/PilA